MKFIPLFFYIFFAFIGCDLDAPRENPLDPDIPPRKTIGGLHGRVIIKNQTNGVSGADIENTSSGLFVTSDSLGYFSFLQLVGGTYHFIISKQNFMTDTFQVIIQNGATTEIVRGLNSAPTVAFQQILTRKIDYFSFSPQYFVDVSAAVSDPNGIIDLDSVWFAVDTIRFPLTYSVSSKKFSASIEKRFFPTNTIEWLVGKPLTIVSRDIQGATNSGEPFYISRVIESSATPINNDTTNNTPLFKWIPPNITFNYTGTVTVYRAGTETVAWTNTGIISFFEEVQYPTDGSVPPLSQGNYFWTYTIVDDFGNYSRSRESYFLVK